VRCSMLFKRLLGVRLTWQSGCKMRYNPYLRNAWFVWVDRYMWFDRCMRFDSCMRADRPGPSAKGCCFTSELHMPLPLSPPNTDGDVVVAARSHHRQTPQSKLDSEPSSSMRILGHHGVTPILVVRRPPMCIVRFLQREFGTSAFP
jgi:hypothetical protein